MLRSLLPVGLERPLLRGWVIDARTRVVTPLSTWTGTPADPADPADALERLDGAFGGGLLWTASYEASRGRFGFHDPLDDLDDLAVLAPDGFHEDAASYTVCGWWSDPGRDPLDGAVGSRGLDARLDDLGWYVDHEGRDKIWERNKSRLLAIRAGLGLRSAGLAQQATLALGADVQRAGVPLDLSVRSPVPDAGRVLVGPARFRYLSLLHGSVLGVPLGELPAVDGRPPAASVRVAAGLDVDDVLAALGWDSLGTDTAHRELAERLAAAFTGGLLEGLGEPDGLVDLAQREHDDGFWPLAGPPLPQAQPDRLRVEDSSPVNPVTVGRKGRGALADRSAAVDRAAPFGLTSSPGGDVGKPGALASTLLFLRSGEERAAQRLAAPASRGPRTKDPHDPPGPQSRQVTRPAPRVFRPQAPMLGLRNLRPSLRHHGDGLHDDSGRLRCRYPDEVGDAYDGVLRGSDLIPSLGSGAVPGEVLALIREAVLLDPYAEVWHAASAAAQDAERQALARVRLSAELGRMFGSDGRYDGAGAAFLRQQVGARPLAPADAWSGVPTPRERLLERQVAAEAARFSFWNGTTPSPVAITTWRQPWVPLWVEWQVRVVGDPTLEGWRLDALDFERDPDSVDLVGTVDRELLGRSPISRGVGNALHEGIERWLEAENDRDQGGDSTISEADEDALARLAGLLAPLDLVSATLDGLREQLLGIDFVGQVERGAEGPDGVPMPVASALPVPLLRREPGGARAPGRRRLRAHPRHPRGRTAHDHHVGRPGPTDRDDPPPAPATHRPLAVPPRRSGTHRRRHPGSGSRGLRRPGGAGAERQPGRRLPAPRPHRRGPRALHRRRRPDRPARARQPHGGRGLGGRTRAAAAPRRCPRRRAHRIGEPDGPPRHRHPARRCPGPRER